MINIETLLTQYGLKYDDLQREERETLDTWLSALNQNVLTVSLVKQYIHSMRDDVERELCKVGHDNKEDIFLKARLRNYMLLESFLDSPEKARRAVEQSLSRLSAKKRG